jgi:hypothetical protein
MGQRIVIEPLGDREGCDPREAASQETCRHRRLVNISDGVSR